MKRRVELYLIDSVIIIVVAVLVRLITIADADSEIIPLRYTAAVFVLYVCIMGMRLVCKNYSRIWRYADVSTYLRLVVSDAVGGAIFYILSRFVFGIPLGIAYSMILTMLILIVTLSSRFAYQFGYAYASKNADTRLIEAITGEDSVSIHKINIAIVGAGNVGASLAGELLRNPRSHYYPLFFIDNDNNKIGNCINGINVYPEDEKVIERIKSMPVQEIIIALPDADADERTKLYNLYKQTDCKVKLYDYLVRENTEETTGKLAMREFRIEDLLFRDSRKIDGALRCGYYAGKTVLVTGGGGSIGSELCRKIAGLNPKKLVILDIYENNAYDIQQELIRKFGKKLCLETVIASVRDVKRMEEIFSEYRPDVVFHAAAHKHVPLMEQSGCEAIKNNVFGTYNTANLAEKYGVKKFILISTDKAVNPTNIMGATKRLCEMIIQCRTDSKTTEFAAVRFGNVLGSNGSVIPLFKQQIEAGGPVTLTDKRIIRYFMTIPEAVGLVLEAGAMAKNGELFVLDMGKPVKILDLAENMIRLSGLKPYEDIDIVEIGLRPGEKLYEELLMKNEELDKTPNKMIFIERDKNIKRDEIEEKLRLLTSAVEESESENGHYTGVIKAIKETVPTYHEPEEINRNAADTTEMASVRIIAPEPAVTSN